jgi:hypothetical protein
LIALPSFSVGESLLEHYGDRIPSLEHRYLLAMTMLGRLESCELLFVCSVAPSEEVLEYYFSLIPADRRNDARARFHLLEVTDRSSRPVAAKLLDSPAKLAELQIMVAGRPALIEPWNVAAPEMELGRRLGIPINGTSIELWPLGFKSAGRRLLREGGLPVPEGHEDLHSIEQVLAAIQEIRSRRPDAPGVVIKTDDSGAGDGNRVLRFADVADPNDFMAELPAWYRAELAEGCVVEELIAGTRFASPSVQVDLLPGGHWQVLATHDQVLGGDDDQVYLGCRFPAAQAYAARLGHYADDIAALLVKRGLLGRVSVDFAASANGDSWDLYALELNIRKGGTTHPYAALRNLVPGHYDVGMARWVADDGSLRCYESTDNLLATAWRGRSPSSVVAAINAAGLGFDPVTRVGVLLHMLSGLAIDGRIGLTAIGTSHHQALQLFASAVDSLDADYELTRRRDAVPG